MFAPCSDGEVVGYAGRRILVTFGSPGYKRLDVDLVAEGNVLDTVA